MTIKIKPLFEKLIPPLSEEAFKALENDIAARGVIDPLIIWNGFLVDGHHRYKIIQKYNLPYKTEELQGVKTETDVLIWMIEHQLSRRNLRILEKADLALEYCELLRKQGNVSLKDTYQIASKIFDIKEQTIQKYKTIKNSGNKKLISLLSDEEKGINEIYKRYLKWAQTKNREPIDMNSKGEGYFHNMNCFDFMKQTINHDKFNVVITEPVASIDAPMVKKFDRKELRIGYCVTLLHKAITTMKDIVKKDCYFFFICDPDDYVAMFNMIKDELFYMDTIVWHKACIKTFKEPYKLNNCCKFIIMACLNTDCAINKSINIVESGESDKRGIPVNVIDFLLRIIETKDTYIFDPFAGYGSVISAAYLRRLKAEGCEIDPDIYRIGCKQVEDVIKTFVE